MRCTFCLIAALIMLPGAAVGAMFSAPLPDLIGVVDFDTSSGKQVGVDAGQQFSAIQNVWIEVEAHVFAQEFDVCGTVFDPQSCVHEVQLLGFLGSLDTEDHPVFSSQSSDGLSFGPFDALDGYGIDVARFSDEFIQSGFNYLLDGEGTLTLFWNRALGNPDRNITNVIDPSGEILNARLIIEGVPLPEPSIAQLFATALLVLAGLKRRERSNNRINLSRHMRKEIRA